MLWTIVKKEFLQQILTRKLMFSLAITFILSFFALHISATRYCSTFEEYSNAVSAQQKMANDIKTLGRKDYENLDTSGMDFSVIRKPTMMSIYCRGMEENFGSIAELDPLRTTYSADPFDQIGAGWGINLVSVLKDSFSTIDFTFMVKFFFSLMVIVISFDIVSNEREQGTLKIIHAQNVSRKTVINAKWLANFFLLSISIVFFFLFSILYVILSKNINFNDGDIVRLFALFFLTLLFVLFFFQTALLFSCIFRYSQTVLITVFIIWILSLFITPNVSMFLTKRFVDIPTLDYTNIESLKVEQQYNEKASEAVRVGNNEKINDLMYEQIPFVWSVKQHYINRLKNQRAIYELLSLISPSQVYSFAAENIMGTSFRDYDKYMDRVRLENENYSNTIRTLTSKPLSERRALSIESFLPMAEASIQNNRILLSKSIYYALPFMVWFIIANGFLYFFTLQYYDIKAMII